MGVKIKGFLICIFVLPILMMGFGLYLDTYCDMHIKNEWWQGKQQEVCDISYQTIEKITSIINSKS